MIRNRTVRYVLCVLAAALFAGAAPASAKEPWREPELRLDRGGLAVRGLSLRDDAAMADVAGSPPGVELSYGAGAAADGEKNPIVAVFLSCVLPGWGELYAGESTRAKYFMATEAAIWLAYAGFTVQGNMRTDDYEEFAGRFAGAPRGMSDQYYDDISDYVRSEGYDSYNEALRAEARGLYPDDIDAQHDYLEENGYFDRESWDWESYARFLEYRDLRYDAKMSFRRAFYMTGLAVLNRAVSAIDSAWLVRSANVRNTGGPRLSVVPELSGETCGSTVRLDIPF